MSWVDAELQDLVFLQRGFDITKAQQRPGTIPVISSSGPQSFHNEAKVKGPGVVVGRKGSVGTVYYTDADFWPHDTTLWSKDLKGNDPKFVYYFLQTLRLSRFDTGNSNPTLNRNHIHKLPIKKPDLDEQKGIASVLSAYDDLIENNRRRIALLEEAARLLYREWFVHLGFPGHEHVKIIDGVPEGWSRIKLGDLTTKLGSGATPRGGAGAYEASGITLIRSLNIYDHSFHDDGLVFINDDQAKKLANVTLQSKDVLINITGASVGRCCIVPERHLPARVNQHVMIVRVDRSKCSPLFVLHSINSHQNKEKLLSIARAGGATREALTKDTIAGFEILVPTPTLVEAFDELTLPMFEQTEILASSISQLTKARDLLLPRLMHGRLEV